MEAPTPVSALMHAGIINAGGALLLRFAPVLVRQPEALLLLTCVGTLTFALGMMAMWAQVKAKRTLAWSTVSQMGFMMVQFGLGAFPVVAVHIVGHGCYKAWSFLRSGEMPASTKAVVPPRRALRLAAMGTAAAVPLIAAASWVTGFSPAHSPGELALTAILAMSVGQLWVAMLATPAGASARGAVRLAATLSVSFVACTAAFAIYAGAAAFLAPVFGPVEPPSGPIAWLAACLPVVTLAALLTIHAWLPEMNAAAWGRALHVHALHGFYFGAIADRFVEWVWRSPVHNGSGANHA
jgi:NAD(P)H-quinone oxidoreductase subunit 5